MTNPKRAVDHVSDSENVHLSHPHVKKSFGTWLGGEVCESCNVCDIQNEGEILQLCDERYCK